ncbi:kinase-like domain-containing protein [Bombardia bombarda]|uniref:EKC/KEOPS complex subunit BUD32 n=1 Tax=Bombardia bombarda TaxID=252184 RepID=A0AA39TPG8_9PEZI|nr:kinase-like domain-containing protein [Bombardia bombarda]
MSLTPPPSMPSETALQSVRENLKDNVFRGVGGFWAKYFVDKSWSAAAQSEMQGTESAHVVGKLAADVLDLAHLDALTEWLATFQAAFDAPGFHFRSQSTTTPDSPFRASIYLETPGGQGVAGSTRVFGEYHHGSAPAAAEDDGDFTASSPHLFVQALAGYAMMSDEECGINTFVKRLGSKSDGYVSLHLDDLLYLGPDVIAAPNYLVGLGTTCYAASASTIGEPNIVVKFSWRMDETPTELQALKRAGERNVWGVIRLLGYRDLGSIAGIRQGLQFPRPFIDRNLSCVVTAPLGRPIQKFASIRELLEVLRDLVKALRSLHIDGRMIHRDIAIKNVVINSQHGDDSPKGVLIDFDQALDLDNRRDVEPLVGSDGFMAIGILSWRPHTYRHDLESLFYVFLWLAIGNDREHDDAYEILEGLPKTSRLWKWCSMDFYAVGQVKAVDMSPEGFLGILDEFSADFASLQGLAQKLHGLIFPVRDGKIFTGTETEQAAIERLYDGTADAFNQAALGFQD